MLGLVTRLFRLAPAFALLAVMWSACATAQQRCEGSGGRMVTGRGGQSACQAVAVPANMRQNAPPEVNFNSYEEWLASGMPIK